MLRTLTLAAAAALLVCNPAAAALDSNASTTDQSINVPTGWWTYSNLTPAELAAKLDELNARLVELEVVSVSNGQPRFMARMVSNSGAYAISGWDWRYDQTYDQVVATLNGASGRLIELERYDRGDGQTRFAFVYVPNSGASARGWTWLPGVTRQQIADHMRAYNVRPVDIDSHGSGSSRRWDAVFVVNTGADAEQVDWDVGLSISAIQSRVASFQGRVVKLDRQSDGTYAFIQTKNTGSESSAWWWKPGFATLGDVNKFAGQMAARPLDITSYLVNGSRYYDATFIDNANAATRRIRAAFAPVFTDGTGAPKGIYAAYLKPLGGSALVNLNGRGQAETASALKVLQLYQSMSRVQNGQDTLGASFSYYNYPGSDIPAHDCPNPGYETSSNRVSGALQASMNTMMADSDNRIARGVILRYGSGSFGSINGVADTAGMDSTTMRHNIGCAYWDLATSRYSPSTLRNDTTAADLASLYEGVWDQSLLTNAHGARDAFLAAANPRTGASSGLQAIINQEAAALGKSSIAGSFGAQVRLWSKGGGYGTCLGNPNNMADCGQKVSVASNAGIIQLPIQSSSGWGGLRTFVYGSFMSDTPVSCWNCSAEDTFKNAYGNAHNEMFREQVRSALTTW